MTDNNQTLQSLAENPDHMTDILIDIMTELYRTEAEIRARLDALEALSEKVMSGS